LGACILALKERLATDSPNKAAIRGNLMYTAAPGTHLNQQQIFVLQHSPLLTPLLTA
jgi:hypothetical protein